MKKLILLTLFIISLFANQDLANIKSDIKLLLNKVNELDEKVDKIEKKVNEIDKKVEINSVKIEMLQKHMNKRFEAIDKRFEDFNKRFEAIDKRFEDFNKRFEDMINYLWMISAAFLGLVAATIGFAIWDRKSMIKAAKEEINN